VQIARAMKGKLMTRWIGRNGGGNALDPPATRTGEERNGSPFDLEGEHSKSLRKTAVVQPEIRRSMKLSSEPSGLRRDTSRFWTVI